MSIRLIRQYYNNVDTLVRYGRTRNETSLRKAFQELLDHYARSKKAAACARSGLDRQAGTVIFHRNRHAGLIRRKVFSRSHVLMLTRGVIGD